MPHQARLRARADPLYFRLVAQQAMEEDAARGVWVASFLDDGEHGPPSFVPVSYLAEIRYPAELAVISGAVVEPLPGGVAPIAAGLGEAMESPWGSASIPVATLVAPEPPAAPVDVKATAEAAGGTTVSAPALPVAHTRAIGPFQAALWAEAADGSVAGPTLAPISAAAFAFVLPGAGDVAAVRLAVVDPLGRMGGSVRAVKGE